MKINLPLTNELYWDWREFESGRPHKLHDGAFWTDEGYGWQEYYQECILGSIEERVPKFKQWVFKKRLELALND